MHETAVSARSDQSGPGDGSRSSYGTAIGAGLGSADGLKAQWLRWAGGGDNGKRAVGPERAG